MALTLLNQIFFNIDYEPIDIDHYNKFMLTNEFMKTVVPEKKEIEPTISINEKPVEPIKNIRYNSKLFSPKHKNKLFWSIYTLHIGEAEYYMIGNKYKNIEMEEKQNILTYIGKNRALIKNTASINGVRFTNVKIQNIESELMIDSKTTWSTFWVMCMFYKINAIVVQDNIFMKFNVDNTYSRYLFTRDEYNNITMDFQPLTIAQENEHTNKKLEIDPFCEKILKGVSTYKIPQLEDMISLLEITPESEKPKKSDLYNSILTKLSSMNLQN